MGPETKPYTGKVYGAVKPLTYSNLYRAKNHRVIDLIERNKKKFFYGSKLLALVSSMYIFELGLASEYFLSFMFCVNTVSLSVGSDILMREFGKRISAIDLIRQGNEDTCSSVLIQNMAGEKLEFKISDLRPVQREIAKSYLNRKDFLHTYPIFADGRLIHI
jgi:hypothetical protein